MRAAHFISPRRRESLAKESRDSGSVKSIHELPIPEFKRSVSLLEEASKTKTPLRVTRRGKVLADAIPASSNLEERDWTGSLLDRIEITGDVISAIIETQEIEALKQRKYCWIPISGYGAWQSWSVLPDACSTN